MLREKTGQQKLIGDNGVTENSTLPSKSVTKFL